MNPPIQATRECKVWEQKDHSWPKPSMAPRLGHLESHLLKITAHRGKKSHEIKSVLEQETWERDGFWLLRTIFPSFFL